jgi:uracil-DNA glycosylase
MDQEIKDETYNIISNFCFGEFWGKLLKEEVKKEYFEKLFIKLDEDYKSEKNIIPDKRDIFKVFRFTIPDTIKVVIVGDYPTIDQSSVEIFKKSHTSKLTDDIISDVFLINTILTIDKENIDLHRNIGWEQLVEESLNILLNLDRKILFVFVGEHSNNMYKNLKIPSENKHIFMNIKDSNNIPNDLFNAIESIFLEYNIKLTYIDGEDRIIESGDNNIAEQT